MYSPLDREAILKDVLTYWYMAVPLANSLLWAINTPALGFWRHSLKPASRICTAEAAPFSPDIRRNAFLLGHSFMVRLTLLMIKRFGLKTSRWRGTSNSKRRPSSVYMERVYRPMLAPFLTSSWYPGESFSKSCESRNTLSLAPVSSSVSM